MDVVAAIAAFIGGGLITWSILDFVDDRNDP